MMISLIGPESSIAELDSLDICLLRLRLSHCIPVETHLTAGS